MPFSLVGFKITVYICECKMTMCNTFWGSLAQLNRAFDYGSKGYRFESYASHKDNKKILF